MCLVFINMKVKHTNSTIVRECDTHTDRERERKKERTLLFGIDYITPVDKKCNSSENRTTDIYHEEI